MKKRMIAILAAGALSLVLACGAGIGRAYAYFTSYVEARGMHPIHLGDWSEIEENYKEWEKRLRIKNKDDSYDAVYVRVKIFIGSEYDFTPTFGEGWNVTPDEDKSGYYYYEGVLQPGDQTSYIDVRIHGEDGKPVKVNEDDAERTVNVVIIYETTPAIQNGTDENGNIKYLDADWSRPLKPYSQTSEAEEVTTTAAEGGDD